MKPTAEQLNCIATAKVSPITVIQACAGAGKTSTLTLMSREIKENSIYLAFNKIAADEAGQKFPLHVTCKTTHSVAYAEYGAHMRNKLSRPKGAYVNVAGTGGEISRYYKLAPVFVEGHIVVSAAAVGLFVKTAVQRFEQSASPSLEVDHVPTYDIKQSAEEHNFDASVLSNTVLRFARRLWEDRINLKSVVLATHDTYLKQWQLSNPVLGYDVIYLDEAQDTTMCVLDVVMRQKHAKIILVGDKRQNIYEWRGSINAMERVGAHAAQCTLSHSFRYGQAVADIATQILDFDMDITGRADIPSITGSGVVDRTEPYAVLCRTNAYLVDSAVLDLEAGKKVSIEIDVKDFVKVLESAQQLFGGNSSGVKHERVVPYTTWTDFLEEAKGGGEIGRVAQIIATEGRVEAMMKVLNAYTKPIHPQVIYTTAHRCKGREFSQVVLGSDFPSNKNQHGDWVGLSTSEQNLLYVAATRAIYNLDLNATVYEIIEHQGGKLKRVIAPVVKTEAEIAEEEAVQSVLSTDDEYKETHALWYQLLEEEPSKPKGVIDDEDFYANC